MSDIAPVEDEPLLPRSQSEGITTYSSIDNGDLRVSGNSGDVEDEDGTTRPPSVTALITPMAIGIFLAAMDGTIVVSSYAAIGNELKELQRTSWIATGYMLTLTSFQPLYGKLSDIFGRKGCLLFAYTIFAIGSLLCGLARSMPVLILARAIAGIGGGGMATVVSIIVSDVVPLRRRGTWQGVLNIVFATGSAMGAPLGGFMADSVGWRWAFLVQVPVTLLAISAVSFALKLPSRSSDSDDFGSKIRRIDFGGASTLVLAVFFLLSGLDRGGNESWTDTTTIASFVAFSLFAVAFGLVEMKYAREPFAPYRIVINRSLIAGYLVNFFGVAAGLTTIFNVTLYFQAVQGKTASESGTFLLPSILSSVAGSVTGGLTIQATGKYFALTASAYFVMLFGTVLVNLMAGVLSRSILGAVIGLSFSSFGNGMGITTSLVALVANAGQEDQAIATAVSYLFRSLGSVVGISVGSTIVQDTLQRSLRSKLNGEDTELIIHKVRESLGYIKELDLQTRIIVKDSYEHAVQATLWFAAILSSLAALASLFIKEIPLEKRNA